MSSLRRWQSVLAVVGGVVGIMIVVGGSLRQGAVWAGDSRYPTRAEMVRSDSAVAEEAREARDSIRADVERFRAQYLSDRIVTERIERKVDCVLLGVPAARCGDFYRPGER